ncbi:hypothetical protein, partial [Nocardia farcinica]|uniref:hypothetical protein n=2 Tax=Nocardia TaxID=1817 RepID=UPI0024547775
ALARRIAAGAACEITVGGRPLAVLSARRGARAGRGPARYVVAHADPVRDRVDRVLAAAASLDPLPLDPLAVDPARCRRVGVDPAERPNRS